MEIKIRAAVPADSPAIAEIIQMALHEEGCEALAGGKERLPLLQQLFTALCCMENSQYSYRNTLVAEDEAGNIAGAIVSYDGARLHELRRAFIAKANEMLGYDLREDDFDDETSPDEIYLDSMAVYPAFRGRGLARRLMNAAMDSHKDAGKQFGLLCAPGNDNAYALYERLGFTEVGMRPFAGIDMHHMTRER